MKVYPFCDPYIWENPKVLLKTGFTWRRHKEGACASEIVNHIVMLYLLALFVGGGITVMTKSQLGFLVAVGLVTAYSIPSFWALMTIRATCSAEETAVPAPVQVSREGFQDTGAAAAKPSGEVPDGFYDVIGTGAAPAALTLPTARNPFMNVLIDEIKYKPKRPVAAAVNDPDIKVGLDDFFRTQFYADPTDVFGKSQSQRQFITQPSTGIPNDQGSYQTWLYGIAGKTCKEGGREACLPGTDGGVLPWLNADS